MKLSAHVWKKYKITFRCKKMTSKFFAQVLYSRKKHHVIEKNLKKNPSSLFVQIRSSKQYEDFFFKKIDLEIFYLLVILRFRKIFLPNKIIYNDCINIVVDINFHQKWILRSLNFKNSIFQLHLFLKNM